MALIVIKYGTEEAGWLAVAHASSEHGIPIDQLDAEYTPTGIIVKRKSGEHLFEPPSNSPSQGGQDTRTDTLATELEKLNISPNCKAGLKGVWVNPARLTKEEIAGILARLSGECREAMHTLLEQNSNKPTPSNVLFTKSSIFRRVLRVPINGKHYRLAIGREAGEYYEQSKFQLWEIIPGG